MEKLFIVKVKDTIRNGVGILEDFCTYPGKFKALKDMPYYDFADEADLDSSLYTVSDMANYNITSIRDKLTHEFNGKNAADIAKQFNDAFYSGKLKQIGTTLYIPEGAVFEWKEHSIKFENAKQTDADVDLGGDIEKGDFEDITDPKQYAHVLENEMADIKKIMNDAGFMHTSVSVDSQQELTVLIEHGFRYTLDIFKKYQDKFKSIADMNDASIAAIKKAADKCHMKVVSSTPAHYDNDVLYIYVLKKK